MEDTQKQDDKTDFRLLIVDDDPPFNKFVERVLTEHGYRCRKAFSADEARCCLRENRFELMLCDIRMPGESGIDLVAGLGQQETDPAVIMMTGVMDLSVSKDALDLGVYGYLIKPINRTQLLITVDNALRRRSLNREVAAHVARQHRTIAELESANQLICKQRRALSEKQQLSLLLEFAGATAHEMNQPLMGLLGHIELLKQCPPDSDRFRHHVCMITHEGERIAAIVKKIQQVHQYKTRTYVGDEKIIDFD